MVSEIYPPPVNDDYMMEEEERGNIQYINFGEADNNDDQDVDYSTLFEPTNQWRCQYCDYSFKTQSELTR